jgi:hypothetical protein
MQRVLFVAVIAIAFAACASQSPPEPEPAPAPQPAVTRPAPEPTPTPAPAPPPRATPVRELPKTASPLPLVGLTGLAAVGLGTALRVARRRLLP